MQLTVWLFTIYKMSPFSCRFKGKFPGTTEHLKGPVFPDGIFQNKIYKIRPVTRNLFGGGANEAKVDPTTEMYFLFSDPFI